MTLNTALIKEGTRIRLRYLHRTDDNGTYEGYFSYSDDELHLHWTDPYAKQQGYLPERINGSEGYWDPSRYELTFLDIPHSQIIMQVMSNGSFSGDCSSLISDIVKQAHL